MLAPVVPGPPGTSLDAYERMFEIQLPSTLPEKIAARFEARRAYTR